MEARGKPLCRFGANCYRKNPKHLESYSHPYKTVVKEIDVISSVKTIPDHGHEASGFYKMSWQKTDFSPTSKPKNAASVSKNNLVEKDMEELLTSAYKKKNSKKENSNKTIPLKRKRKGIIFEADDTFGCQTENKNIKENEDSEILQCKGCIIRNHLIKEKVFSSDQVFKNKTMEDIIKKLFLVDMPPDFYSFYEFCKSIKNSNLLNTLKFGELKLVGPFDILSEKMTCSLDADSYLCHWRFYYDPPEFQTVLATESGYHIGYWRDDPKENPVFLASNDSNKNCIFKIEAENLFGAVFHYLNKFTENSDSIQKENTTKLQAALRNWAEKNKFSLKNETSKIIARKKKIVAKTFHEAGIVVPVEAKTRIGYRPLIETEASLRKICNLIMKANNESERESLWENLQPLITAANIANDECDFGNSLELGIDLFCMGSSVFHGTIEHLLSTAYSLLNRSEFEKIIKAHLKFRRKDNNMSSDNHLLLCNKK